MRSAAMAKKTLKMLTHVATKLALSVIARGSHGILINNHVQDAQQIRTQVEALAPYVEFISYGDLADRIAGPRGKKPFCLLTFDDGKAINAEETGPELFKMGVPAVFYLVTGLTGTRTPLWFDCLAAVHRANPDGDIPGVRHFKTMTRRDREAAVEELCSAHGVTADVSQSAQRVMTWEQAARMERDGFELGAHTVNHAILTNETPEEAEQQLGDSVRHMRERGLRCRSFAFPNGNTNPELVQYALSLGLESTVSTVPLWLSRNQPLDCLPRLYMKDSAGEFYVQTKTLLARSGFLLKNPNGEGRRYRSTLA